MTKAITDFAEVIETAAKLKAVMLKRGITSARTECPRREAARKAAEKARKADAVTRRKENRAALNSNPEAVYGRIRRAIPRTIPADIRDDIANDIAIGLLDGEIAVKEIEASVRTYLSRHFRAREWSSVWSLDAIIPGTDGLRRIDTIAV